MNRFEANLRIPGPTSLPDAVREAGARQMVNHRGPEFAVLQNGIIERLKKVYKTENDVLIVTAAGTGGLESAIVSFLSPGDKVLGITIGAFGDRFAKIATAYGADVTKLAFEWGQAADPAKVREALAAGGPWKAVLMTQNETSTAVTNPIPELAEAVHELAPDALVIVDAISGLGAVPFETDAWGLDVVVSGSQKAWMVGPGLSFVSVSPRAWEAAAVAKMPKFYFDLARPQDQRRVGPDTLDSRRWRSCSSSTSPWTMMEQEGLEEIWKRHEAVGAAVRAGLDEARLQAAGRSGLRLQHRHRGLDPRGPRLEGLQRQAPQARPGRGRRAGQPQGQDLPYRPPGPRHGAEHPQRHGGPGAGPASSWIARFSRARPSRPPRLPPSRPWAWRSKEPHDEDPRCRAPGQAGSRDTPRAPRGRREDRPLARRSWPPSSATTTPCWYAARSRSRPTSSPTPRAWSSSAGPAWASTTWTSKPPPRPASWSSTPPPATPSRPPSRRSPSCWRSPARQPRPTPRCAGASGSAAPSPGSSCGAGPWASSAWARSAWPWRIGPAAWR